MKDWQYNLLQECDEFKKLPINKVFLERNCYVCCQLIGDGYDSKAYTKRRKCRNCDGKHPTVLHGLQLKKNDKGKSEKGIRKREVIKVDSTGLIYVLTKMN